MAMLDQLLGLSPFGGGRPTFEQAFPVPMSDETAAVEEAAEAAARRQKRGVRHTNLPAPMRGEEIPGMGLMGSLGMLSEGGAIIPNATPTGEQMPPSTNDPASMEPQVFSAGVPIPRPRPVTPNTPASVAPTDMSSASAPLSLAPPSPGPEAAPQAQGGGIGGFLGGLLKPENAPLFLSLAGGFSGAGSLGTGMRRAFAGAVPAAMMLQKDQQTKVNQREMYDALIARNVSPREAIAALKNPELMKALVAKHYETRPAQIVNNRLVRENADGTVKVLGDYSDPDEGRKPEKGYVWTDKTMTSQTFIPGGPADPKVKAQAAKLSDPPKYEWVDPNDHSKGQRAIPGGPGEKVDANVAARLGLAQSYLDQLPEIRKSVKEGFGTGPIDATIAKLGYGKQGELKRRMQSGAEALLRNLTGAGMNKEEAAKYVERYELQLHDTADKAMSKIDQLERELRYTMEAVSKGRGGTPEAYRLDRGTKPGDAVTPSGKTKNGLSWSIVQ